MNIAFLLRFWPQYGGGESIAIQLANEFIERGHEVTVYYLWDNSIGQSFTVDSKIKIRKVQNCHPKINIDDIDKADYAIMKLLLRSGVIEDKTNILINIWWPTKIVNFAIKKLSLKPKIFTCYYMKFTNEDTSPKRLLFQKIFGKKITNFLISKKTEKYFHNDILYSDKWVLMSEQFVNDAKKFIKNNYLREKIISVPSPVRYSIGADEEILQKKKNVILFIGRFVPWKRIDILLTIWKNIQDRPELKNWKLQLIGDGPCMKELKNMASTLNLHDVMFDGSKEPLEAYQNAKIVISASELEGMPQSLIEAMRNGCTAIASGTYSAIVDIINNGKDGYIIPKGVLSEFEERILELVSDDKKLYEMEKNAVASSSKFTISNVVDTWERLF